MFDSLDGALEHLREGLRSLDPALVDADAAKGLVEVFAELERLAAAGKTLCMRRVAATRVWAEDGDRSPAHWLARTTGSTVGGAVAVVETSRRLEHLPDTVEALRAGELSAVQVEAIASAAAADPMAEAGLLDAVTRESVRGLREQCRRVEAAALDDEVERYQRIHAARSLRHWIAVDGAFRMDAVLTPDAGATVLAALAPYRERMTRGVATGVRERPEALAADALVAMAEDRTGQSGSSSRMRPAIQIRIDHSAFVRGHVEAGEVCEISGIGSIPVAVARTLAEDAVLTAVVTDGTDVRAVARMDRTIPAVMRRALEARDPVCAAPGCDVREGLEIHHLVPFARGGPTSFDNLQRLCRWHHHQATHHPALAPVGKRRRPRPPDR